MGADFDEVLLAGHGRRPAAATSTTSPTRGQITDYITSEVGEALDVVARDVDARRDRAGRLWPSSRSARSRSSSAVGRTVVNLGSLVAEQVVQVVLRLELPVRRDRPRDRRRSCR